MVESGDIDVLERRFDEELTFVKETTDPSAAQLHRQVAVLYAARLLELRCQGAAAPVVEQTMDHHQV